MTENHKLDNADLQERIANNLDWNLLRTFVAIVQHHGVTRAAEKLHVTQSAVSQSLKRLEQHLDCRLVERNPRSFRVTEIGEQVFDAASEIYSQISRMARTLDEAEEQTYGNVRLLITSRVESLILDRILKNYHVKHPNVSFRIDVLTSPEIPPLIQQGQATAGVSFIRKLPTNVGAELLARVKYGLYCGLPHRLYGNSNLTVTDLRTENFVTFATDHLGGVLSPLTIYREQHGYEGKVVGTSYNLDEIKRMAFAGIGIGLFPCHIVEHDVENGRLWQLPSLEGIGPIDWYFLWDKTANLTNSEYLFVELAKAEIANTPIELRVR